MSSDTLPEVDRTPNSYVLDFTLTNNQTLEFSIQIQEKADFEWVNRIATPSAAGQFRVNITDGRIGRTLIRSTNPGANLPNSINNENYFGTAQLPNPFVQPYTFFRSSTIQVTIQNTSGGGLTGQIVFEGFDLRPVGQPSQGSSGAMVNA